MCQLLVNVYICNYTFSFITISTNGRQVAGQGSIHELIPVALQGRGF